MKIFLLGFTLLVSMSSYAKDELHCVSKVIKPACFQTYFDPQINPKIHYIFCKGYVLGRDLNGNEAKLIELYDEKQFFPGQGKVEDFLQMVKISDSIKKSLNHQAKVLTANLKNCE